MTETPKTDALKSSPTAATQGNALLVGGDPDMRSALTLELAPEGWVLEEVSDLDAALAAARAQDFQLIVTSRDSSGQEDVQFLRQVRRIRPHARVIIVTDESKPEDVIASMREHAFGYLSRGLSVDSLAQTVRAVLDTPTWTDGIEIISATPELITLAVRGQMLAAERLLQFLGEITDLPEDEARDAGMAFREMLLNAIEHGGKVAH